MCGLPMTKVCLFCIYRFKFLSLLFFQIGSLVDFIIFSQPETKLATQQNLHLFNLLSFLHALLIWLLRQTSKDFLIHDVKQCSVCNNPGQIVRRIRNLMCLTAYRDGQCTCLNDSQTPRLTLRFRFKEPD